MSEKKSIEGEVSWNLSQALIFEVGQLLSEATQLYSNGNLLASFFKLKAIKLRVVQDLSDPERVALETLEKEAYPVILIYHKLQTEPESLNKMDSKLKQKCIKLAAPLYEKYSIKIMDTLGKHAYTISKKEDRSKLIA